MLRKIKQKLILCVNPSEPEIRANDLRPPFTSLHGTGSRYKGCSGIQETPNTRTGGTQKVSRSNINDSRASGTRSGDGSDDQDGTSSSVKVGRPL